MKIVQAAGWFFPDTLGGTEVYVDALSRRLAARGHDVQIVAPDPSGRSVREYDHRGLRVFRYPIVPPRTRDEAQGRRPIAGAERFHAWIAREHPDVVHFHTLVPGLELPEVRAARDTGARIIATTHASSLGYLCSRGTMMQWGENACDGLHHVVKCAACELQKRGTAKPLARLIARLPVSVSEVGRELPSRFGTAVGVPAMIARNGRRQAELLDSVASFVVLTRWARDVVVLNGAPPAKVAINRLGYGHARPPVKPEPSKRPTERPIKVGYVGRFDPIKGPAVLARAVASLPRDISIRVHFRGPAATSAEQRCRRDVEAIVANDPRVETGPAIPYDEVLPYLEGLDVLCCPSLCLEGGPTIAIESHAVGTPVIGSRIGGLAELVADGRNGRLVAPGDVGALANVLRQLVDDPAGTIDRWRTSLPPARTMDDVASEYLALYAA